MRYETLFYYPEENIFVDELGNIVHDIYRYVPLYFLYLFRDKREYMVYKSNDIYVEIHYVDEYDY